MVFSGVPTKLPLRVGFSFRTKLLKIDYLNPRSSFDVACIGLLDNMLGQTKVSSRRHGLLRFFWLSGGVSIDLNCFVTDIKILNHSY